jgi:hypothetical protein
MSAGIGFTALDNGFAAVDDPGGSMIRRYIGLAKPPLACEVLASLIPKHRLHVLTKPAPR